MLLLIVHTNSTIDFYVSPCFPYKNVHHPTGASKNSIYKGQLHTYLSVILLNAPLSEKAIDISSFLKFLPQSYKEIVTFLVTPHKNFQKSKIILGCVAKSNSNGLSLRANKNFKKIEKKDIPFKKI